MTFLVCLFFLSLSECSCFGLQSMEKANTVKRLLQELHSAFRTASLREDSATIPVRLVLGNEAADTDSVVSALVYAALLWLENDESFSLYAPMPVVNFPRKHFRIQVETVRLIEEGLQVAWDELFFIDDPLVVFMLDKKRDSMLILTDHNKLTKSQEQYQTRVIDVIDHHVDESISYPNKEIELVGSCCTLIARRWLNSSKHLSMDAMIAKSLVSVISLDTVGLNPEMKKLTPTDMGIVEKLEPIAKLNRLQVIDIFMVLTNWRSDISTLNNEQLLLKDYKVFPYGTRAPIECGIASLRLSWLDYLLRESDTLKTISLFIQEQKLEVLILMFAFWNPSPSESTQESGVFHREVCYFSRNEKVVNDLHQFFNEKNLFKVSNKVQEWSELRENMRASQIYADGGVQIDMGFTRKQMQPILKQFFV